MLCIQIVNSHLVQVLCLPRFSSKKELCDSREIRAILAVVPRKFKAEVEVCNPFAMISPLLVARRSSGVRKIQTAIIPIKTLVVVITPFVLHTPAMYHLRAFLNTKAHIHPVSTLGQALLRYKIKRHEKQKARPLPFYFS